MAAILIIIIVILIIYYSPRLPYKVGKSAFRLLRELRAGYKEEKERWRKEKMKEKVREEMKEKNEEKEEKD